MCRVHQFGSSLFIKDPSFVLYLQVADDSSENENDGKAEEIGTSLTIRGTIQGEAFVHGKATVKEGIQVIKGNGIDIRAFTKIKGSQR
jgi:hypothetical protein